VAKRDVSRAGNILLRPVSERLTRPRIQPPDREVHEADVEAAIILIVSEHDHNFMFTTSGESYEFRLFRVLIRLP
jgi:hypothetical protein